MPADRDKESSSPSPDRQTGRAALDALAATSARVTLVEKARAAGSADAERHQEDLLGRQLPVRDEVHASAEQRIEIVNMARTQAINAIDCRRAAATLRAHTAQESVDAANAMLVARTVSPETWALPPLRSNTQPAIVCAIGASGLALAALAAAAVMDSWAPLLAMAPVALALLWLARDSLAQPEDGEITALRGARADAVAERDRANTELSDADAERREVIDQSAALAHAELALARERLAAYLTAAAGALPPGALADGADFSDQADPAPDLPHWAESRAQAS